MKTLYSRNKYIIKKIDAAPELDYPMSKSFLTERGANFKVFDLFNLADFTIEYVDAAKWEDDSVSANNMLGTISVTNAVDAIVGVGTTFLTQLTIGDKITIEAVDYFIDTITDDTNATLTVVYAAATDSGLTASIYRTFYTTATLRTYLTTNTAT